MLSAGGASTGQEPRCWTPKRRIGTCRGRQSEERVAVHEVRDTRDAQVGCWCVRQQLRRGRTSRFIEFFVRCQQARSEIGLTKSAALGYGNQGLRINVVCTGWIRHSSVEPFLDDPELKAIVQKMEPAGRLGHPGCLPVGLHRLQRTRRIHLKAVGEDSPGYRDAPAYEHHHDEGYPAHR